LALREWFRNIGRMLGSAWEQVRNRASIVWHTLIEMWLWSSLRFFRSVGVLFSRALLWILQRIRYLSIKIASKWGRSWLEIIGAVVVGTIPCVFYGFLLYVLVSHAERDSLAAWFVILLSQCLVISWILYLMRPIHNIPMMLKGELRKAHYTLSTFLLLTTMYACAYMAAGKLGNNGLGLTTGCSLAGFWNHMRFSVLTATTLGQPGVATKGLSCVLECVEVSLFWLLVVMGSWTLPPKSIDSLAPTVWELPPMLP
jgi:hypothetical protein